MDWSIQEVARLAGTTSRTLRHYDGVGLLKPTRIGPNGYRRYDGAALVRLQRIMLLREMGMGLPAIAGFLSGEDDDVRALERHLACLVEEQGRRAAQIRAVRSTIESLREGGPVMPEEMFEGFDPGEHREEVERRWGASATAGADRWWSSLGEPGRRAHQREHLGIQDALDAVIRAGLEPGSDEAQDLARRLYEWVVAGWQGRAPDAEAFVGLGEMYVADERFAAHYTRESQTGARFLRDAMRVYADRNLR